VKKITRAHFLSSATPLLALGAGAGRLLAQDTDTPIIIADGSLKMNSAVPWGGFAQQSARRRAHPNAGKRVTRVELVVEGNINTSVQFNNQQCEVTFRYAGANFVLFTNPTGRNLRIDGDWSKLLPGDTPNDLQHSDQGSKITRVIVKRAGSTVADQSPSGGTRITLHYED
jgi:hypothetical protein